MPHTPGEDLPTPKYVVTWHRKCARIPVAVNGFALGLAGLSGLLRNVNKAFYDGESGNLVVVSWLALLWSFCTGLLYVAKCIVAPHIVLKEFKFANTNAAIAPVPITIALTHAQLYGAGVITTQMAWFGVLLGLLLQLADFGWFAYLAHVNGY